MAVFGSISLIAAAQENVLGDLTRSVGTITRSTPRFPLAPHPLFALYTNCYWCAVVPALTHSAIGNIALDKVKENGQGFIATSNIALDKVKENSQGFIATTKATIAAQAQQLKTKATANPPAARIPTHRNENEAGLQARAASLDGTEEHLRRAIEVDPNSAQTHNILGNVLNQKGNLDGAEVQYRRAIEIDPNYVLAHFNLGIILERVGNLDGAEDHYHRAIEIDPSYAKAHTKLNDVLNLKAETQPQQR